MLFTGDAVGRHIGDADVLATEKFMVDNATVIPIDSDVLIAPHFIRAVSPKYVIFASDSRHKHPRAVAAERYLKAGIPVENLFRIDLGDHEDDDLEWSYGRITGHRNSSGDDNVIVKIAPDWHINVLNVND